MRRDLASVKAVAARPQYRWLDPAPPAVQAIRERREAALRLLTAPAWVRAEVYGLREARRLLRLQALPLEPRSTATS
jgi:hypothetical protein